MEVEDPGLRHPVEIEVEVPSFIGEGQGPHAANEGGAHGLEDGRHLRRAQDRYRTLTLELRHAEQGNGDSTLARMAQGGAGDGGDAREVAAGLQLLLPRDTLHFDVRNQPPTVGTGQSPRPRSRVFKKQFTTRNLAPATPSEYGLLD